MRDLRLFIAIPLGPDLKESISQIQNLLKRRNEGVRWVNPQGLHLTLKFLGNTPQEKVPKIGEAMRKALSPFGPFRVLIKGAGGFPSLKKARVLWVGVEDEGSFLKEIFKSLEKSLQKLGFPMEDRPFKPHITLGRLKNLKPIDLPEGLEDQKVGVLEVREVILFKSELKPEGAEYHPLIEVPLGGGEDER